MTDETETDTEDQLPEGDTFPRAYVEELRGEAAGRRSALREAEERAERYGRELFAARIAATGRLADPTDLAYDPALLDDQDALGAALDDLVARKRTSRPAVPPETWTRAHGRPRRA